jgi:heat shock protein HslJ
MIRTMRGMLAVAVTCLLGVGLLRGNQPAALNDTAWVLAALPGRTLVTGVTATLRFEAARATGSDGCNRFTMTYTATDTSLRFAPSGISTQMACPDPVMRQAAAFTSAMSRTRRHLVQGGQLQLLGEDGGVLAVLDPQSTTLAGTSWDVTGFNNGKQAVVSVVTGTALTMTFGNDGNLSGSAGCNSYTASFTAKGRTTAIGSPASTRKMCGQPPGVMDQEQQFLRALPTAGLFRMEGERLEMRTADDSTLVLTASRKALK